MKIVIEWTETIERVSVIDAPSVRSVQQRLADGDDDLFEEIEAVSVEQDGGGFTFSAAHGAIVRARGS